MSLLISDACAKDARGAGRGWGARRLFHRGAVMAVHLRVFDPDNHTPDVLVEQILLDIIDLTTAISLRLSITLDASANNPVDRRRALPDAPEAATSCAGLATMPSTFPPSHTVTSKQHHTAHV